MLDPQSIRVGKINYKKLLHFLAGLIIWPGAKIFNKNKQWSSDILKNLRNDYYSCIKRNTKQRPKKNQNNFLHQIIQYAPILSSSKQWIWQGIFILNKLDGFQSDLAKVINISWWITITIQIPSMQNLLKRELVLNWKVCIIKFIPSGPTKVYNQA